MAFVDAICRVDVALVVSLTLVLWCVLWMRLVVGSFNCTPARGWCAADSTSMSRDLNTSNDLVMASIAPAILEFECGGRPSAGVLRLLCNGDKPAKDDSSIRDSSTLPRLLTAVKAFADKAVKECCLT